MKEEFLLQYDSLSEEDRVSILVEVMNGHQENNLSSGDLDRLRSLPLFTSYPDKQPTSVAEYEKVFYCTNDAVLDTLSILSQTGDGEHDGDGDGDGGDLKEDRGGGGGEESYAQSITGAPSLYKAPITREEGAPLNSAVTTAGLAATVPCSSAGAAATAPPPRAVATEFLIS